MFWLEAEEGRLTTVVKKLAESPVHATWPPKGLPVVLLRVLLGPLAIKDPPTAAMFVNAALPIFISSTPPSNPSSILYEWRNDNWVPPNGIAMIGDTRSATPSFVAEAENAE